MISGNGVVPSTEASQRRSGKADVLSDLGAAREYLKRWPLWGTNAAGYVKSRAIAVANSSPFRLVLPEGGSCSAGLPRPGNALLEASQYVTPLIGLGKYRVCCMQEFATLGGLTKEDG